MRWVTHPTAKKSTKKTHGDTTLNKEQPRIFKHENAGLSITYRSPEPDDILIYGIGLYKKGYKSVPKTYPLDCI